MEALILYILKASGVLLIFYLVYQIFLKNETFFESSRHFLLAGLLTAVALPFVSLKQYVTVSAVSKGAALATPVNMPSTSIQNVSEAGLVIDWYLVLAVVYFLGLAFLLLRFCKQLLTLRNIIVGGKRQREGDITRVETKAAIAPFSFFQYIVYNPEEYDGAELSDIIAHEKAHCRQRHSLDILLSYLLTMVLWPNPISWFYKKSIQQNLEYLADAFASQQTQSLKTYQYTLLKVSGNAFCTQLTNSFYNSLIKKRIVMLHKSKSDRRNLLKTLVILPALALFLYGFNTKKIYVIEELQPETELTVDAVGEKIEIRIDKDTSDEELEKIKKKLAKKGFDFSYTVVHNDQDEITSLSIDVKSKISSKNKVSGSSTFYNDGAPIDPVTLVLDDEHNMFFMGDGHADADVIHETDDHSVWVFSGDTKKRSVEITEDNGKKTIRVNGKIVSEDEYGKMKDEDDFDGHHVKIKKSKKGGDSNVMIIKDSDDDADIEVIGDKGFFFIDADGDEDGLFLIDGKESTREAVKALSPDEIEKIEVSKGKGATEKYGDKAKNGVVEITTKKND